MENGNGDDDESALSHHNYELFHRQMHGDGGHTHDGSHLSAGPSSNVSGRNSGIGSSTSGLLGGLHLGDSPELQELEAHLASVAPGSPELPLPMPSTSAVDDASPPAASTSRGSRRAAPPAPLDLDVSPPPRPAWMQQESQLQSQSQAQSHSQAISSSYPNAHPRTSSAAYTGLGLGLPFSTATSAGSASGLPASLSSGASPGARPLPASDSYPSIYSSTSSASEPSLSPPQAPQQRDGSFLSSAGPSPPTADTSTRTRYRISTSGAPPAAASSRYHNGNNGSSSSVRRQRSAAELGSPSSSGAASSPEMDMSPVTDRRGLVGLGELATPRWTSQIHERRWGQGPLASPVSGRADESYDASLLPPPMPLPGQLMQQRLDEAEEGEEDWQGDVLDGYAASDADADKVGPSQHSPEMPAGSV